MTDPYANLAEEERSLVMSIAIAIGNGLLLPHNRIAPSAARRVFDELKRQGRLAPEGQSPSSIGARKSS